MKNYCFHYKSLIEGIEYTVSTLTRMIQKILGKRTPLQIGHTEAEKQGYLNGFGIRILVYTGPMLSIILQSKLNNSNQHLYKSISPISWPIVLP
jgi:hypothetical protein